MKINPWRLLKLETVGEFVPPLRPLDLGAGEFTPNENGSFPCPNAGVKKGGTFMNNSLQIRFEEHWIFFRYSYLANSRGVSTECVNKETFQI